METISLQYIAEQLINYIDARLSGNLDKAYKIKRNVSKKNPAESMICFLCDKCSNKGEVIVEEGELKWICSRCQNIEIIRKNTLFTGKK